MVENKLPRNVNVCWQRNILVYSKKAFLTAQLNVSWNISKILEALCLEYIFLSS